MKKFNFEINPETTYCSDECYKREIKKFIWSYQANVIKREFKSLMKHFGKFISLIYKYYLKDHINVMLKISIILITYFILSEIIYLIETCVR